MTNVWPATLPQYVQVGAFGEQKVDNKIRTKQDDGSYKIRRRFTLAARQFQLAVQITAAQKTIFDDFYQDTLADGSLSFDWVLPATQDPASFVFLEEPSFAAVGPDVFTVTMKLQTKI